MKGRRVGDLSGGQQQLAIVLAEQYFDFAYGLEDEFCVLNREEAVLSKPASAVAKHEILERVSI